MKNNYLVQAWLVLMLACCFGAALAGVEAALGEKIAANKLAETMSQIPKLVPGAVTGESGTIAGRVVYKAMDAGDRHVGWVVAAKGQGFADKLEILIGLDRQAQTITGLYVLDQKETPGLGNKIVEPRFLGNFPAKDTGRPLEVVNRKAKAGTNEVESVTGATISSRSVCDIVNETMAKLRDKLAAKAQ